MGCVQNEDGMSANIISLAEHLRAVRDAQAEPSQPSAGEIILLEEGLDLLAAYRSIADRKMRFLLKALVHSVAEAEGANLSDA